VVVSEQGYELLTSAAASSTEAMES